MTTSKPQLQPKKPGKKTVAKNALRVRRPDNEVNQAPVAWGRRVARLVGDNFGVRMVADRAKNEGEQGKKRVVIKCAKSTIPPIFVSAEMLTRVDEVWGVFLSFGEGAQVWSCPADFVRRNAYFTHNPRVPARAEITLKTIKKGGTLLGTISQEEIEACHVP